MHMTALKTRQPSSIRFNFHVDLVFLTIGAEKRYEYYY